MDKRGGKRKGAGRKPTEGETRTEVIMVRLKKSEMEALDAKRDAARGVVVRKLILAWLRLSALAVVGCSGLSNTPESTPIVAESAPIFCQFDLVAPRAQTGQLTGYFGDHGEDCIPPEGGSQFTVSLGLGNGDYFKLFVPRPVVIKTELPGPHPRVISMPQPFWHMIAMIHSDICTEWSGELVVQSDLPNWSVYVDASCITDPSLKVQGQLSN